MDLTGKYEIPAPAREVWTALNDPQILAACVPGCDSFEKVSATEFVATASVKIGLVKTTLKSTITLSELDPPRRCIVRGEAKGGRAGFLKGEAEVLLEEKKGFTTLFYSVDATLGGKFAKIGQRIIDNAARQIADEFFGRFAKVVTQGKAPAEMAASWEWAAPDAGRGEPGRRVTRLQKIWIGAGIGAAALVAVAAFLLTRHHDAPDEANANE